ncbi:hypothetical protein [Enterococcus sp. AZ192]|uniref:hypothetical protein n=1 Tax=unclassified Enterococcus TaxID=2608891 RepID=UPI003D2BEC7C
MRPEIQCTYQTIGAAAAERKSQTTLKIMQLFIENGQINIGEKSYPIVYGDLYFIAEKQSYSITETNEELIQSTIEISAEHLKKVAKLLDFESEYKQIFEERGSFQVASPRYKAIDHRFKEAASVFKKDQPFAEALFFSRVLELLNYAVVTIKKTT